MLKLTVFVNGKDLNSTSASSAPAVGADVKKELREIRDRVNRILDQLGDQASPASGSDAADSLDVGSLSLRGNSEAAGHANGVSGANGTADRINGGKEFDPLQQQQQQVQQVPQQQQDDQKSQSDRSSIPSATPTPTVPSSSSAASVAAGDHSYHQQQPQPPQPQQQQQPAPQQPQPYRPQQPPQPGSAFQPPNPQQQPQQPQYRGYHPNTSQPQAASLGGMTVTAAANAPQVCSPCHSFTPFLVNQLISCFQMSYPGYPAQGGYPGQQQPQQQQQPSWQPAAAGNPAGPSPFNASVMGPPGAAPVANPVRIYPASKITFIHTVPTCVFDLCDSESPVLQGTRPGLYPPCASPRL